MECGPWYYYMLQRLLNVECGYVTNGDGGVVEVSMEMG
jgi:hypothetical protein